MAYETTIAVGILSPLLVLLIPRVVRYTFGTSSNPLPPGPRPLPLFGNLFDLPGDVYSQCKMYQKWCKNLDTDILYLNVLGTSMIVLNSYEATWELLVNRSTVNSGRVNMPMVDLIGWNNHFGFMDYGDTWKRHRNLVHQQFNTADVKDYEPQQTKAARVLVKRLLNSTECVQKETQQMTGELILSITYGIDAKSPNDPYIDALERGARSMVEAGCPRAFLVNTFPLLRHVPPWFPGAGFKRKATEWRKLARKMVDIPFGESREAFRKGIANRSFVMKYVDDIAEGRNKIIDEEDVKSAAGTIYQAGSHTTANGITSGILALLENPSILKTAQKEMDSVVTPGRFPEFSDRDSLRYTTAIVKEVLRWTVIAPIAVPHRSASDNVYKGYLIPAGSMLIPNVWEILHDKNIFPEPDDFIPERFLKDDKAAEERLEVAWGYGCRACPGRYLAFSTVWIALACIIALYDVSKSQEESLDTELSSKHPIPPFKAIFRPRSKAAEDLINGCSDI